jgi:hypothetical protein
MEMTYTSRDQAIEVIRSIERRCLGTIPGEARERVIELLQAGDDENARRLNRAARAGCAADFNDIIVEGPWDGQEHDYQCPACGQRGRYRAPRFPGLE